MGRDRGLGGIRWTFILKLNNKMESDDHDDLTRYMCQDDNRRFPLFYTARILWFFHGISNFFGPISWDNFLFCFHFGFSMTWIKCWQDMHVLQSKPGWIFFKIATFHDSSMIFDKFLKFQDLQNCLSFFHDIFQQFKMWCYIFPCAVGPYMMMIQATRLAEV